jgi:hypothetical protein
MTQSWRSLVSHFIHMSCNFAWIADELPGHLRDAHQIKLSAAEKELMTVASEKLGALTDKAQVVLPGRLGPPVEGLLTQSGWRCQSCLYAAVSKQTAINHSYEHKDNGSAGADRIMEATVQVFWKNTHKVYFVVEPELATKSTESIWACWLRDQSDSGTATAAPIRGTQIPQLLRHTNWHIHLGVKATDVQQRKHLLAMTQVPKRSETGLGALHQCAADYLLEVRNISLGCSSYVLKALKCYPV